MNPAIGQLVEKGRRSLNAAESLLERGDYDFAVSRAYYAMFYLAEAALLERGLSFSKHSAVISAFGRELIKTGCLPVQLYNALRNGFDARSIGDYGASADFPREHAYRILDDARQFVDAVEAFLSK